MSIQEWMLHLYAHGYALIDDVLYNIREQEDDIKALNTAKAVKFIFISIPRMRGDWVTYIVLYMDERGAEYIQHDASHLLSEEELEAIVTYVIPTDVAWRRGEVVWLTPDEN